MRQGFLLGMVCVLAAAIAVATASAGKGPYQNVSISSVSQPEGNSGITNFVFWVSLTKRSPIAVKVDYATSDGTATAGSDYAPVSGTLWFNAGEISKKITVSVIGDTNVEPNETFNVTLSNPKNIAIGVDSGIGTILDDDFILCIPVFGPLSPTPCPCPFGPSGPSFNVCE